MSDHPESSWRKGTGRHRRAHWFAAPAIGVVAFALAACGSSTSSSTSASAPATEAAASAPASAAAEPTTL